MARTLDERSIPATLVVFPDEGHGLARPENNLAFVALTEVFLAPPRGRYQPIDDALSRLPAEIPIGPPTWPGESAGVRTRGIAPGR